MKRCRSDESDSARAAEAATPVSASAASRSDAESGTASCSDTDNTDAKSTNPSGTSTTSDPEYVPSSSSDSDADAAVDEALDEVESALVAMQEARADDDHDRDDHAVVEHARDQITCEKCRSTTDDAGLTFTVREDDDRCIQRIASNPCDISKICATRDASDEDIARVIEITAKHKLRCVDLGDSRNASTLTMQALSSAVAIARVQELNLTYCHRVSSDDLLHLLQAINKAGVSEDSVNPALTKLHLPPTTTDAALEELALFGSLQQLRLVSCMKISGVAFMHYISHFTPRRTLQCLELVRSNLEDQHLLAVAGSDLLCLVLYECNYMTLPGIGLVVRNLSHLNTLQLGGIGHPSAPADTVLRNFVLNAWRPSQMYRLVVDSSIMPVDATMMTKLFIDYPLTHLEYTNSRTNALESCHTLSHHPSTAALLTAFPSVNGVKRNDCRCQLTRKHRGSIVCDLSAPLRLVSANAVGSGSD